MLQNEHPNYKRRNTSRKAKRPNKKVPHRRTRHDPLHQLKILFHGLTPRQVRHQARQRPQPVRALRRHPLHRLHARQRQPRATLPIQRTHSQSLS